VNVDKMSDLLRAPWLYLLSQTILGAKRARKRWVVEYVKPSPGLRVLDIGCGPGYILEYLPDVSYCGFDTSPDYIAYAKHRYGKRGKFYCQRFDAAIGAEMEPFDVVLMAGLLHHLGDLEALDLLKLIKLFLVRTGSLITLDGCYIRGQSLVAKCLLNWDRGKCVREEREYVRLASSVFGGACSYVRDDLFSIPYTALVMVCRP
jgi:SAM-dependent methyltransferase